MISLISDDVKIMINHALVGGGGGGGGRGAEDSLNGLRGCSLRTFTYPNTP